MIAQVALTVICIVPAIGDYRGGAARLRSSASRFPAEQYLAVEISDRSRRTGARGRVRVYVDRGADLWRARTTRRTGTWRPGDHVWRPAAWHDRSRAPRRGGGRRLEPDPILVPDLWTAAVGPGYFEMFDRADSVGSRFSRWDLAPGATKRGRE